MARLKETYKNEIAPALMSKFGYKSVMQIPKLEKVVLNIGCSELKENPKVLDAIMGDLSKITGQKPVATKPGSPSPTSSSVRAWSLAPR